VLVEQAYSIASSTLRVKAARDVPGVGTVWECEAGKSPTTNVGFRHSGENSNAEISLLPLTLPVLDRQRHPLHFLFLFRL